MRGRELFREWASRDLTWLADAGVGFFPVRGAVYDRAYFDKYVAYSQTELGRELTAARVAMVARHWSGGELVDVGIGCGHFIEAWPGARGYDVNPAAVAWLRQRGRYANPYHERVEAACFWDSFEHIHDPSEILANVTRRVFMALPIFSGLEHVRRSKHFRKDEHCWYFTRAGLLCFMAALGWQCVERNAVETDLGREDIESFAFVRP